MPIKIIPIPKQASRKLSSRPAGTYGYAFSETTVIKFEDGSAVTFNTDGTVAKLTPTEVQAIKDATVPVDLEIKAVPLPE
jgi:hypothetical protein